MARYFPIKAFGVETQVPAWAASAIALVLTAGLAWMVYERVYAKPEQVLVSLKDANEQLAAEVEEYSLHAMEEPEKHELFEDSDGKLALRVYKDHCVLIQRQTRQGTRTKLVMDLARAAVAPHHISTPQPSLFPTVFAQGPCQRGCLNPHPGQFQWWYGQQVGGGWVEVWRRWPEGCTHVQLFQPQTGAWDANSDGTPRVRWTCCVH